MIVSVLGSIAIGVIAAIVAMMSGMSLIVAFLVYVSVGVSLMLLALLRAMICLHLKDQDRILSHSR